MTSTLEIRGIANPHFRKAEPTYKGRNGPVSAQIIDKFSSEFNGKPMFACDTEPVISANPYVKLGARIAIGQAVNVDAAEGERHSWWEKGKGPAVQQQARRVPSSASAMPPMVSFLQALDRPVHGRDPYGPEERNAIVAFNSGIHMLRADISPERQGRAMLNVVFRACGIPWTPWRRTKAACRA